MAAPMTAARAEARLAQIAKLETETREKQARARGEKAARPKESPAFALAVKRLADYKATLDSLAGERKGLRAELAALKKRAKEAARGVRPARPARAAATA